LSLLLTAIPAARDPGPKIGLSIIGQFKDLAAGREDLKYYRDSLEKEGARVLPLSPLQGRVSCSPA